MMARLSELFLGEIFDHIATYIKKYKLHDAGVIMIDQQYVLPIPERACTFATILKNHPEKIIACDLEQGGLHVKWLKEKLTIGVRVNDGEAPVVACNSQRFTKLVYRKLSKAGRIEAKDQGLDDRSKNLQFSVRG
jgi:hypothetical protein